MAKRYTIWVRVYNVYAHHWGRWKLFSSQTLSDWQQRVVDAMPPCGREFTFGDEEVQWKVKERRDSRGDEVEDGGRDRHLRA